MVEPETAHLALARYACRPEASRGRVVPQPDAPSADIFQSDRGRIVHSAAFRRLEYKTQVFVNHEGDLFRTRLTHTLEVAQIARNIARSLGLNEDLVEAIALAHDLGHPPFGHAGQSALNHCMGQHGGFEHNLQALRIVDVLEERYAQFDGLNLSYETREGILKHCSLSDAQALGEVGRRFVEGSQPSLEAQLVNVADEIAYLCHDLDDALRAELIELSALRDVALLAGPYLATKTRFPALNERRLAHEIVPQVQLALLCDVTRATSERLCALNPQHPDEVRAHDSTLVGYSSLNHPLVVELRSFLNQRVYRHYRVERMSAKAQRIVTELFQAFYERPVVLPPPDFARLQKEEKQHGAAGRARVVADYIAGMTDRYASLEYRRLFDPMVRA